MGGDHDYLRLPVKKGGQYLLCTFDLGPGVDTVLELFWGTSDTPIAGNDDARPNASFLSVLRWVAPADGDVLIRIAPRTGGANPVVFDAKASTYRFAVALSGSALAKQLEARIAEQTNAPTPTPASRSPGGGDRGAPTAAPAPASNATPAVIPPPAASPAAGASSNPSGATVRGQAIVVATATAFRIAPNGSLIQTLPADTIVTLGGQYSGLWVSVTTIDSVLPGWVLGTDLRRVGADQTPVAGAVGGDGAMAATPAPGVSSTAVPTATGAVSVLVRPLAPLPIDPLPSLAPRASLTVSVTVVAATTLPGASPISSARTPTPAPVIPREGVRVQLVNAFGDVLAEAVTGPSGQVALTRELAASSALFVRLPAAGLELMVDPRQPHITIALPGEER
jgi:hypothetical protein